MRRVWAVAVAAMTLIASAGCEVSSSHAATGSLQKAIEAGDLAAVKRFVEQGEDPNARDGSGNTALHTAVICNNPEVVAYLVQNGADPERPNARDFTPLQLALENGSLEAARVLRQFQAP